LQRRRRNENTKEFVIMDQTSHLASASLPNAAIFPLRPNGSQPPAPRGAMPVPMGMEALQNRIGGQRRRIKRGDYLYRYGAEFHALYGIHAGSFKTVLLTEDGREQVTGFHMAGEVIGLDGLGADAYNGDAIALEDGEVIEIASETLDSLVRHEPMLQRELFRMLAYEIQRERALMLLLGSMRAEERLAAFLLNLSQRLAVRGYSPTRFILRMTREEIGSLLGLKLETVSRILSRFQNEKMIRVRNREIDIQELDSLRSVIGRNDVRREEAAA
jgi:CRP/FNR family transcriptional regulator